MAASKGHVVLKAVKKITVQFCPFESNAKSTREFLTALGPEKVRSTNSNCEIVTEVKHDRSEPIVDVAFADGERLVMKGAHLTAREMLQAFQTKCSSKESQEDVKK
ncbi:39S ribosomal protein L53, mitochondrial [Protopterus annectens]|uniref:39S ribosomal protein L53, mitochondrial n=1 Tax=Protopterus annectens TaxID=7888 RepID=UPI001CFBA96F|nr:39S ribosomal protein L53, mitochondrial [Protopterus annectens]